MDISLLFEKIGEKEFFKKGDYIFKRGDVSDSIYFIKKGKVEISVEDEGKRRVLAVLKDGEILGEMTIFQDFPRSADAVLLEDTEVLKILKTKFNSFMKENPEEAFEFTREITKIISDRIRILNKFLLEIFNFSVELFSVANQKELSELVMKRIVKNLNPDSAFIFLWNRFNNEFEPVLFYNTEKIPPSFDNYDEKKIKECFGSEADIFPVGKKERIGFLVIIRKEKLKEEEKVLIGTISFLIGPLIQNLWYKEEEENLRRLKFFKER